MDPFMQAAIDEARLGLAEGGIPIGSVLVIDGKIVGRGHNRRVQKGSAILHAEVGGRATTHPRSPATIDTGPTSRQSPTSRRCGAIWNS